MRASSESAALARATERSARASAVVRRSRLASRMASRLLMSASARRSPRSAASRSPSSSGSTSSSTVQPESDRGVAAQEAQGRHLQSRLALSTGPAPGPRRRRRGRRRSRCGPRGRLRGPAAPAPACPRTTSRRRATGRADRARPRQRPGRRAASPASSQPWAARGSSPACVRVLGHHLGPVGGQVGGAAVVGQRQRRGQRGVDALLQQVVGELVVVTAAHEQAEPDQLLAGARRRHVGQLDQRGHQGRVDAAAQHRGRLDHRAAGAVEPRDTVEDGVGERLGHAGVTLRRARAGTPRHSAGARPCGPSPARRGR